MKEGSQRLCKTKYQILAARATDMTDQSLLEHEGSRILTSSSFSFPSPSISQRALGSQCSHEQWRQALHQRHDCSVQKPSTQRPGTLQHRKNMLGLISIFSVYSQLRNQYKGAVPRIGNFWHRRNREASSFLLSVFCFLSQIIPCMHILSLCRSQVPR